MSKKKENPKKKSGDSDRIMQPDEISGSPAIL